MASHPSRRTVDVLRELCQEEVQAAIDPIRHEITFLRLRLQTAISDLREEVSDLKQQLQASGRQSQMAPSVQVVDTEPRSIIRNTSTMSSTKRKISKQGHYAIEHPAETHHRVGMDLDQAEQNADFQHDDFDMSEDGEDDIFADDSRARFLSPEYTAMVKRACVEYALMPDCWGAATLVIVKDFPDIGTGIAVPETFIRTGMVLICWGLNILLQVMLLVWVYQDVLRPQIASVQLSYKKFHGEAFIAGRFDVEAFDSLGGLFRDKLCKMALTNVGFTCACTFLWVAKCLNEIRVTHRSLRSAAALPFLPAGVEPEHMAYEVKCRIGNYFEEKKVMIVCLDVVTRVWLFGLIFLPRIMLDFCLLFIGVAFLTATETYTDLILNSLALAFLYDTGELIFRVFLPQRLAAYLGRTKIVTPVDLEAGTHFRYSRQGSQLDMENMRGAYRRSLCFMIVVIFFMLIWFYMMPIMPGFQWDINRACWEHVHSGFDIPCRPWEYQCFPK